MYVRTCVLMMLKQTFIRDDVSLTKSNTDAEGRACTIHELKVFIRAVGFCGKQIAVFKDYNLNL